MGHETFSIFCDGPWNFVEEFRMGYTISGGNIIFPSSHPSSYFMTGPLQSRFTGSLRKENKLDLFIIRPSISKTDVPGVHQPFIFRFVFQYCLYSTQHRTFIVPGLSSALIASRTTLAASVHCLIPDELTNSCSSVSSMCPPVHQECPIIKNQLWKLDSVRAKVLFSFAK